MVPEPFIEGYGRYSGTAPVTHQLRPNLNSDGTRTILDGYSVPQAVTDILILSDTACHSTPDIGDIRGAFGTKPSAPI